MIRKQASVYQLSRVARAQNDTHIGGANFFKWGRAACSLASRVILDPDVRRAVKMAPAFVARSIRIARSQNFKLSLFAVFASHAEELQAAAVLADVCIGLFDSGLTTWQVLVQSKANGRK
jgi:hypothetical protein